MSPALTEPARAGAHQYWGRRLLRGRRRRGEVCRAGGGGRRGRRGRRRREDPSTEVYTGQTPTREPFFRPGDEVDRLTSPS